MWDGNVKIFDCQTGEQVIWIEAEGTRTQTQEDKLGSGRIYCTATSGADLICNIFWTNLNPLSGSPFVYTSAVELRDHDGNLLYTESCDWIPNLSPNGAFLLGECYDAGFFGGSGSEASSTPFEVMRIKEVQ